MPPKADMVFPREFRGSPELHCMTLGEFLLHARQSAEPTSDRMWEWPPLPLLFFMRGGGGGGKIKY